MKLNIFFTAGYFKPYSTIEVIEILEKNGVDRVEVGMPYSDPVVDGPVIQQANKVALANGMTIQKLFDELQGLKEKIKIPVVLMGYLNPVLQYGVEKFCQKAKEVGIHSLIIPDLPPEMYEKEYKAIFEKHNLKIVFIVTPQTTAERMQYLDDLATDFIYAVADSSITGSDLNHQSREAYFQRLKDFDFKNECYVGFGIRTKEDLSYLSQFTDGGIIGTAFIQFMNDNKGDFQNNVKQFIRQLK